MSHGPNAETIDRAQVFIRRDSLWRRMPIVGAILTVLGLVGALVIHQGNKTHAHHAEEVYEQAWGAVEGAADAAAREHYEALVATKAALEEALDQKLAAEAEAKAVWQSALKGAGSSHEAAKHAREAENVAVEAAAGVVKAREEFAKAITAAKHGKHELAEKVGGEVAKAYEEAEKTLHLAEADVHQFWFSYLTSFMGFLAFGLGGLFFVIVQHLVRAGWSVVVRRLAENLMITLPFMAILALPLIFYHDAQHALFHWTHTEVMKSDLMLASKEGYLNHGFFQIRLLMYFGAWALLSYFFYSQSTTQDDAKGDGPSQKAVRMRWWAPVALVVFAMSLTFCAFDLLMSLDPHWFSTMFGVYYFAGVALSTHALLAILVIALHKSNHLRNVVTVEHYHDLGKYMFGFTVFWTYIGFSQWFLIWYANIPEETSWFAYRTADNFFYLSLFLAIGRFVIPFFYLMRRPWKRMASTLLPIAIFIVFMEFYDMFWLVQPAMAHNYAQEIGSHHMELVISTIDYLAFLGIGGFFLMIFSWRLCAKALVPVRDPRLTESLQFENF